MKRIFTSAAVMAAVALSSCMNESTVVPSATEADAISFNTFVDTTTKGAILDNDALKASGFGVFAYSTEQDHWADVADTATPDFMFNQAVYFTGGSWSYSPTKYWSNVLYDNYSFFAYAPLTSSNSGVETNSANDAAGAPSMKFTVNSDAAKMIDFVAGQAMDEEQQSYTTDGSEETPKVSFNLKHQLTRVSFSASTNISDENTAVVITGIKYTTGPEFDLYESGVYTFAAVDTDDDETGHEQDGVWSDLVTFADGYYSVNNITKMGSVSFGGKTYDDGIVISGTKEEQFISTDYLFFLPPNGQDGLSLDQEIQMLISYDIVTIDSNLAAGYAISSKEDAIVTFDSESMGILKQGRAYNFELTFDLSAVKLKATTVDWDEETLSTETGVDTPVYDITSTTAAIVIGANKVIYLNDYFSVNSDATYPELTWAISSEEEYNATRSDGGCFKVNSSTGKLTAYSNSGYGYVKAVSTNPEIGLIMPVIVMGYGELKFDANSASEVIVNKAAQVYACNYIKEDSLTEDIILGTKRWSIDAGETEATISTADGDEQYGILVPGSKPGVVTITCTATGQFTEKEYTESFEVSILDEIADVQITAMNNDVKLMSGKSAIVDFAEGETFKIDLSYTVLPVGELVEDYEYEYRIIRGNDMASFDESDPSSVIVDGADLDSSNGQVSIKVVVTGKESGIELTDGFTYYFTQKTPELIFSEDFETEFTPDSFEDNLFNMPVIGLNSSCLDLPDGVDTSWNGNASIEWTISNQVVAEGQNPLASLFGVASIDPTGYTLTFLYYGTFDLTATVTMDDGTTYVITTSMTYSAN